LSEQRTPRPGRFRLIARSADRPPPELIALDQRTRFGPAHADTSIRVLIAAGRALVLASYRALLESDERIEVVAEAASGEQALALARDAIPDVALLDLELPGLNDLETIARVVSHPVFARVPVMLIAPNENDDRVLSALRAGAVGVLAKDAGPAELIRAVQLLARGDALFPAGVVRRLVAELPSQSVQQRRPADQLTELTGREREVVALVATGLSNGEIAAQLVISPATAKTHVSRAMIKLQARNRAQLVVLAYETGLVLAATAGPAPAIAGPAPATAGPAPATAGPARATGAPVPATGAPVPATGGPVPVSGPPAEST
jgi:DNA-binding NarL/FixJ family response regulator